MRIRLLVAMKARKASGESYFIYPGIYDTKNEDFPEALREERRHGIVQILDAPGETPEPLESESVSDANDPDNDADNDDLPVSGEEETEEEAEEVAEEEEAEEVKPAKKKGGLKRRG